jgi:hypothetical protein
MMPVVSGQLPVVEEGDCYLLLAIRWVLSVVDGWWPVVED